MEGSGSLQQQWMQRAELAYRRMLEGEPGEELLTLSERGDMAVAQGKELAAFLLEEHVALDPAARLADASAACCPKCGQAGTPFVQEDVELRHCTRNYAVATSLALVNMPEAGNWDPGGTSPTRRTRSNSGLLRRKWVGSHDLAESGRNGDDHALPRRARIATGGSGYHELNRALRRSTIFEKVVDDRPSRRSWRRHGSWATCGCSVSACRAWAKKS